MSKQDHGPSTKQRILDGAERLFAEKGTTATSMREITDAARVNLAAVNYHFGSKEGLIAAVFRRHLAPLAEARLAMLDEVESAAGGTPASLEAVLEAFIRPAVVRALDPTLDSGAFSLLMGRCLSEPGIHAKHVHPHFETVVERFDTAVARTVPELPRAEITWRMAFASGGLHHTIQLWSKPESGPFKMSRPLNVEELIRRIVSFVAAGMRSRPVD